MPNELQKGIELAAAIDCYHQGLISQGRATELAGTPHAAFLEALAARKVDVMHVDLEELKREIDDLACWGATERQTVLSSSS